MHVIYKRGRWPYKTRWRVACSPRPVGCKPKL